VRGGETYCSTEICKRAMITRESGYYGEKKRRSGSGDAGKGEGSVGGRQSAIGVRFSLRKRVRDYL